MNWLLSYVELKGVEGKSIDNQLVNFELICIPNSSRKAEVRNPKPSQSQNVLLILSR